MVVEEKASVTMKMGKESASKIVETGAGIGAHPVW